MERVRNDVNLIAAANVTAAPNAIRTVTVNITLLVIETPLPLP